MRLSVILLFLCITLSLLAQPYELTTATQSELFKVQSQRSNEVVLHFQLPSIEIEKETINGKEFVRIKHMDAGYLLEAGKPELPTFSTFIAIPVNGDASIEVADYDSKTITNTCPIPSLGLIPEDETDKVPSCDTEYYRAGQIYPSSIAQLGNPQIMRDLRIVNVQVQPFTYNPITNSIEVKNNIVIKIKTSSTTNQLFVNSSISRAFEPIYEATIANYNQIRDENPTYQARTILAIYPSNVSTNVMNQVKNYAKWKHQKGFDVTLVSTSVTGSTNTAIKTYIQNAYNTWPNKPEYVVLIGDANGNIVIPTWTLSYTPMNNGEGDINYTYIAGNDYIGDLLIGRIPISSDINMATVNAKISLEEKIPNPNLSWYPNAVLAGDVTPSGYSCIDTNIYIRELMRKYYPGFTFHEVYGTASSDPSSTTMANFVNSGASWFNYRGYIGMSGWSGYNMNSLTNTNKMVNGVFITCGTGVISSTSASENFLLAGSPTAPVGGSSAIGMSTSHTLTPFNNCLSTGVFHGLYADGLRTMGQAIYRAKMNLHANYDISNLPQAQTFSQICNLFGDPAMEVWVAPPKSMTATYPSSVNFGTNFIPVTVRDASNQLMKNVWVTISQPNDSLYATGYTDANGQITLPSNPQRTGSITIVITKPDYTPILGTIAINSSQACVGYSASSVDDDNNGGSVGNSNAIINSGETIELRTILHNYLTQSANNVSAILRCSDPYVTLIDSVETFPNIAAAANGNSTEDFDFAVADNCPNQHILPFFLIITANNNTYTSYFNYVVGGVDVDIVSSYVQDNANHILDPGEAASLQLTICNNGALPLTNVTARLRTHSPYMQVTDSLATFGNIAVSSQANNQSDPFVVHTSVQALPGLQIPFEVVFYSGNTQLDTEILNQTIGTVTVTSPLGPDSYGYVCYDNGDTSYPDCPNYSWIEIAPSLGGSGTSIGIVDSGDNEDSTAIKTINLPFTFNFYGKPYTQISVCSNGFIAMGVSRVNEFRNWAIPGPGGPSPMIAPFWDDLVLFPNSGIYSYYDASNHTLIIEWSKLRNRYPTSGPEETFQVILYDPAYYQTSMGDGPIKFQYKVFNNTDSQANEDHGDYSTIGIEDHSGTVGLQYSFNNSYPTAAHQLGNERALFFTNLPISSSQPLILLNSCNLFDENNNIPEAGELIRVGISLANVGLQPATNVHATISSSDANITILNGSSSYADIALNEIQANQQDYLLRIAPNCPDDHSASLNINITANNLSWTRSTLINVQKPNATFESLYINDSAGNNNGIVNPGETITLIANIQNNSALAIQQAVLHFNENSSYLTETDSLFAIPEIPAGKTIQIPVTVQVSASTPNLSNIPFTFRLTGPTYLYSNNSLLIGASGMTSDFESNNGNYVPDPTTGWTWGVPSAGAHSGAKCWAVCLSGQYADNINWSLTSPAVTVASGATLSFYHSFLTENSYDGGNVEISTNNGQSFTVINPVGNYPDDQISALNNEPGYTNNSNGWVLATFNLSDYIGQTVLFRWHFASDGSQVGTGWFIDDVTVNCTVQNVNKISGVVSLNNGNGNIALTQLSVNNIFTYAKANGNYCLYMAPGTYTVKANLNHYEPASSTITLPANNNVANVNFALNFLQAPQNLVASYNAGIVNLTWDFSSRSSLLQKSSSRTQRAVFNSFKIFRQVNTGNFTLVDSTSATQYSQSIQEGNIYHYYVVASYSNPNATSLESNIVAIHSGNGPSWVPITYANVTTAYCKVTINNLPASNNDVLGAFVNNECRAIAPIIVNQNEAYSTLQIYGVTPETVSFSVWDASAESAFTSTFVAQTNPGNSIGSTSNYLLINALSQLNQTLELNNGWNLISLDVHPQDMTPASVFAPILDQLFMVKDLNHVYSPSNPPQLNTLASLNNGFGYWVKTNSNTNLTVAGTPIIYSNLSIPLNVGWNLIGYPVPASQNTTSALASIIANVLQVKSLSQTFNPAVPAYLNTLTQLQPNNGYWIKVSNACSLTYPNPANAIASLKSINTRTDIDSVWSPVIYTNSMVVYTKATIDNATVNPNTYIGAFVGDECRAVQPLLNFENNDYAALVVNTETPETISFRLFNTDTNQQYTSSTSIQSSPGSTLDNILNLNFTLVGNEDPNATPATTKLNSIYPNPFNPETNISFDIAEKTQTNIRIYNAKGQLVKTLVNEVLTPGKHSIVWKGRNNSNQSCASGVYFVTLKTNKTSAIQKVLLLK